VNAIFDLMTGLVAGVIVGGRVGYFLFYQPASLLSDPLILVRVWEGGMASHGGFIGVTVALWWFTRKRAESMLQVGDLVATTVPLGLFFGRVANFINGELWGKVTEVPWAVIFSSTGGGPLPRHPSQLYEAALEGWCCSPSCNGVSGKAASHVSSPAASRASSSSPTRWRAPCARSSASPTPG
jgi:phosphatidylglycerol:prolipoprotein diacylglycerol transferase